MFNVMIVEDEMLVRLGFKNSIPWEKYDMTICADAANGHEAWDYYHNIARPDVIITDLRMPEMNGMELIKRIRENDTQTRIVILSCLEDFDLVRQAMQLNVSNYILKLTMTEKEIDKVLLGVREELGQQQSLETSKGLIRNPHSMKENIIKNFLFYNLYTEEEFIHHIANLKLRLNPVRLIVGMMEIDHFKKVQAKFKDEKGELVRATILNVLNELLAGSQRGEVVGDDEKRYLFIFSFRDKVSESQILEELHHILTHIQKLLDRFFNISATFGISGMRNEYSSLRSLYQESVNAIDHKYFYGNGRFIFNKETKPDKLDDIVKQKLLKLSDKWAVLEKNDQMEMETIVQAFYSDGRFHREQDIRKLFLRFPHTSSLSVYLDEMEVTKLDSSYGEEMQKCDTLDESIDMFGQCLDELVSIRSKKVQLSKEVALVVQYIKNRFDSDISLQQIAEELELTPNYVSALFKKELDVSFSEYLNRVRMEKAKELLLKTNLKSYEIADQVGFSDDSYFSRAFKKHVGVRPNGFRRLWVND